MIFLCYFFTNFLVKFQCVLDFVVDSNVKISNLAIKKLKEILK